MHRGVEIQSIFLCALNVFFTLTGVTINSLAIVIFWKSSQLRRKLCYVMIMVLSCVDLLTVLTNQPTLATYSILFMTGKNDLLRAFHEYVQASSGFFAISLITLLVMCLNRYLAVAFPIFHRTSITKKKLLTLLVTLYAAYAVLLALTYAPGLVSSPVHIMIFLAILAPPFLFVNIKLIQIARRMRKNSLAAVASSNVTTRIQLKSISSCLMVVACCLLCFIPPCIYFAYSSLEEPTSAKVFLSDVWSSTVLCMSCTLNSLVFFWKNKILRKQGVGFFKQILKLPRN